MWDCGFGAANFTLAHEMYHWFAHRVRAWRSWIPWAGRILHDAIKGHLESQADGVGARILMPRMRLSQSMQMLLITWAAIRGYRAELAVTERAAFFGASKTAMKKRPHELGLHEETRRPAVRRRLDIVEMFTQSATDKGFRDSAGLRRVPISGVRCQERSQVH